MKQRSLNIKTGKTEILTLLFMKPKKWIKESNDEDGQGIVCFQRLVLLQ